jgi:hypothetical protein
MKIKIRIVFGICSYMVALVLLLTPFITDPHLPAAARIIPFLCGAFLLTGTLVTDFELGLAYGQILWLLTMVVGCQGFISFLAYSVHTNNRHNMA